jgi:hypothetical protein
LQRYIHLRPEPLVIRIGCLVRLKRSNDGIQTGRSGAMVTATTWIAKLVQTRYLG